MMFSNVLGVMIQLFGMAFISETLALNWSSCTTFPHGTPVEFCTGDSIILPWLYDTTRSENVESIEWSKHTKDGQYVRLATKGSNATKLSSGICRPLVFVNNAGILLPEANLSDAGNYTVTVTLSGTNETYSQTAKVNIAEAPVIQDGGLTATVSKNAVQSYIWEKHIQLECGTFQSLGYPPVTVAWKTPVNKIVPSTSHNGSTFFLILPVSAEGGDYSCFLSKMSQAARCLSGDPTLKTSASLRECKDVKADCKSKQLHRFVQWH